MKQIGFISDGYRRLLQLGKIVGALTFLFGIPYGIEQYWQKQYEGRISETLELFKQFNGPPFSKYREDITTAVATNNQAISEAAAKGAEELRDAVVDVVSKTGIETDLLMTMDFFDAVVTCVEQNLCDRDTAQRLFSPRARELFTTFFQYMELRRNTSAGPNFGIGLQIMARMKPK